MGSRIEAKPNLNTLPRSSTSSARRSPSPRGSETTKPIVIKDDDDDVKPKEELDPSRIAEAKSRHEADLKKHAYEDNSALRIEDE